MCDYGVSYSETKKEDSCIFEEIGVFFILSNLL